MINGDRVRQSRELKGLTQLALARCANVSQAAIAQIENGAFLASDDLAVQIAKCTSQPLRFFQQESAPEFETGSLLFRAHSSMGKREITEGYRHAQMAFEIYMRMRKRVRSIPLKITPIEHSSPADAARKTRKNLGLNAEAPIPHLINVLEWHGLIALVIPEVKSRDAFSVWQEDYPVMALSANRSGDRARMSTSHELGHLVLHRGKSRFDVDEDEADEFAAEFLMPKESISREITTPVTLSSLAALKPRWRVSIQALVRRCKDIGVITDRHYRYLFGQLSSIGWRTKEPIDVVPERPRAFRQMAEFLYGNPPDLNLMASDLCVRVDALREALEYYAPKTEAANPIASNVIL